MLIMKYFICIILYLFCNNVIAQERNYTITEEEKIPQVIIQGNKPIRRENDYEARRYKIIVIAYENKVKIIEDVRYSYEDVPFQFSWTIKKSPNFYIFYGVLKREKYDPDIIISDILLDTHIMLDTRLQISYPDKKVSPHFILEKTLKSNRKDIDILNFEIDTQFNTPINLNSKDKNDVSIKILIEQVSKIEN